MPVLVLLALTWFCVRKRQLGAALLLLTGFDSFLRTGEMLSLTYADIVTDPDDRGVVRLGHTKTGQRHAAFEASVINDPVVGKVYRALKRSLPIDMHPDHYIFPQSQYVFYKLFHEGLDWIGVKSMGFQPYSIRRGGATAFFRATRNMEATLDRGRWASARVARIYVNDGLAKAVELQYPEGTEFRLATMAKALEIWLMRQS